MQKRKARTGLIPIPAVFDCLLHLHPTVLVPILVRLISGLSGAASTNFFLTRSVDLENSPPPPINSESDTMVKFQQRYQNSHRIVISGIVGYSLNADTPDDPPDTPVWTASSKYADRFPVLTAGDQSDLCIR